MGVVRAKQYLMLSNFVLINFHTIEPSLIPSPTSARHFFSAQVKMAGGSGAGNETTYIEPDLTHLHTSVLDEIAAKVRELDKQGSSSIVYSRIIADCSNRNYCGK